MYIILIVFILTDALVFKHACLWLYSMCFERSLWLPVFLGITDYLNVIITKRVFNSILAEHE